MVGLRYGFGSIQNQRFQKRPNTTHLGSLFHGVEFSIDFMDACASQVFLWWLDIIRIALTGWVYRGV
ncbi:hypothetical protein [Acaryochloris thomasi]|uniref:hypothetical protein n=1 Tax=Acaryochloris thomasi TaxID=2929456 RepID=UPI001314F294|nr:hypothetical protein [Acaryochloris thomasi]